jgi:hypothetical protein
MKKKSAFKTLMEGMVLEKFGNVKMSLERLRTRNASVDEIKKFIIEAAKKAKKETDDEAKHEMALFGDEVEKGWGDAELAHQVKFAKALNIKEMFFPSKSKKKTRK